MVVLRQFIPLLRILGCTFALLWSTATARALTGDFTLTSNLILTNALSTSTYDLGGNAVNLQSYTLTYTGVGDFDISAPITGSGSIFIDLLDPSRQVIYEGGNGYTGLTTVRSGILYLESPGGDNNGIVGDLYIGGGGNQAMVRRDDKHNHELIADASTITVARNGTLEFDRMGTGNSPVHDSLETFSRLIMDGGTILNASDNSRNTKMTVGSVTLLSSSVWDLGKAMTINVGDIRTSPWDANAILTIRNWSSNEPIYVANLTPQQLSQIRFDLPQGLLGATQLPDTQIVPAFVVPEASSLIFVPLLIGAALWPEIKRRVQKHRSR